MTINQWIQVIISKIKQKPLLITVVLTFLISTIAYSEFLFQGRIYGMCSDFYSQFIPEISLLREKILSGEFPMWSFAKGLGQQMLVGNPNWTGDIFTYLTLLIGGENFIDYFGIIMQLKIILASVFFYLFLNELNISKKTKILFSVMYAFNGHMILRGMWIHYATEVVFVALWLWALEMLFQERKKWFFSVSFAILLISRNIAYIYIYSILTYLYITLREIYSNGFSIKRIIKKIFQCIPYYLLGIGIAAVIVLPGIYSLLSSNRLSGSKFSILSIFSISSLWDLCATYLKSFSYSILGLSSTSGPATVILEDPVLYCGIITMLLVPQIFCFKEIPKKKKYTLVFLIALIILYYVLDGFRYFLNAFNTPYYKTSSFWTIILLNICGVVVMDSFEKRREQLNKACLLKSGLLYLGILTIIYIKYEESINTVSIILVISFIITYMLSSVLIENKSKFYIAILLLSTLEITTGLSYELRSNDVFNINRNHIRGDERIDVNYGHYLKKATEELKESDKDFFRVIRGDQTNGQSYNISQTSGYYGIPLYSSITNQSIIEFYEMFELGAGVPGSFNDREYLNDILSVKYYLKEKDSTIPDNFEYSYTNNMGIEVYKNTNFLPFGYVYSNVISSDAFNKLDIDEREKIITSHIVLDEKNNTTDNTNINKQSHSLEFIDSYNMNMITNEFPDLVKFESINNDPAISLRVMNDIEYGDYTLKMEITSNIDTGGQVYFYSDEKGIGEKFEVFSINKGTHSYTISFKSDEKISRLRLDIGNGEGIFEVRDISLNSQSAKFVEDIELVGVNNINIKTNNFPNILEYVSTNGDPMMNIAIKDAKDDFGYKLTMKITSSSNTGGQIYYSSGKEQGLIVKVFQVKRGTHLYTISFQDHEKIDGFRLDIGDKEGVFKVSNIKLISESLKPYEENLQSLKNNALDISYFSDDKIIGDISMEQEGVLFLSIPFDKGWKVKINGEQGELIKANIGFTGVKLKEGDYEIILEYTVPWLVPGCIITIISLAVLCGNIIYCRCKVKVKIKQEGKYVA